MYPTLDAIAFLSESKHKTAFSQAKNNLSHIACWRCWALFTRHSTGLTICVHDVLIGWCQRLEFPSLIFVSYVRNEGELLHCLSLIIASDWDEPHLLRSRFTVSLVHCESMIITRLSVTGLLGHARTTINGKNRIPYNINDTKSM